MSLLEILPQADREIQPEGPLSQGQQARLLWDAKFAEFKEVAPNQIQFLYTGIGDAPFLSDHAKMRRFGDGTTLASYFTADQLKQRFGEVPKILFLIASPLNADHIINLKGVARHYKEEGIEKIITVMTSLAHERQDHTFPDPSGNPIHEITSLKDVIGTLAAPSLIEIPDGDGPPLYRYERAINGAIVLQPHSLRSVEFGLRMDFPILPLDALDFIVERSRIIDIQNPVVLGPDKGRKDEARRVAEYLGCEIYSAEKKRDRLRSGDPTITFPDGFLNLVKENGHTVVCADDEIREAGTMGEIAKSGIPMVILAIKSIMARKGDKTAIDQLNQENILHIFTTDAVMPLNDVAPIAHKMTVFPIGPEIEKIITYFKNHLVDVGNPNWLDPQETGTPIRLDLTNETYS